MGSLTGELLQSQPLLSWETENILPLQASSSICRRPRTSFPEPSYSWRACEEGQRDTHGSVFDFKVYVFIQWVKETLNIQRYFLLDESSPLYIERVLVMYQP